QRVTRMASNDRFGIDIVIALDGSGSMAAEDFRPRNRFAVAKDLIGDFISKRQDDRIGIVTFGVRAATRVPITYDREVAGAILERAQVGENGDGTAIGHAIATAVNRLRTSKSRSRIIILVTDARAMSAILDRIDRLEKTRLTAPKSEKIDELYLPPLAGGFVIFALALLGGETLWLKVAA